MKNSILVLILAFTTTFALGQGAVNLKKGYAAEGYDVVSYFQDKPVVGDKSHTATHEGVQYKFESAENLQAFKSNPDKYIPQYGGFCAYAVAVDGKKVGVNPKTYIITDGKLYLFYNSWGVNTLKKWKEEGPKALQDSADLKWTTIKESN